jgi:tetratricopeptide (TPR) repeat protein
MGGFEEGDPIKGLVSIVENLNQRLASHNKLPKVENPKIQEIRSHQYQSRSTPSVNDTTHGLMRVLQAAVSAFGKGDYDGGVSLLRSRPRVINDRDLILLDEVSTSMRRRDLSSASELASEMSRRYPDSAEPYNFEAILALIRSDIDRAYAYFSKSLSIEPANLTARRMIIEIYIHQKQFDAALNLASESMMLYPANAEIQERLTGLMRDFAQSLSRD